MDRIAVLLDILKTGFRISGGCWISGQIQDISVEYIDKVAFWPVFDRVTQRIEACQFFKYEKNVLLNTRFTIYLAGYPVSGWILNLNQISGPSLILTLYMLIFLRI